MKRISVFRTAQRIEEGLRAGGERIVLRRGQQRGTGYLFGAPVHGERLGGAEEVAQIADTVNPIAALDDAPAQLGGIHDDLLHAVEHLLVEFRQIADGIGCGAEFDGEVTDAAADAPFARVGDAGREAVFARGGARCQMAAEAPAVDRDACRIDQRQVDGKVDDGTDDSFPIGAQAQSLLIQRRTLAWAIENQAVIAALRGGDGGGEVRVGDGRVIAIGEDQQGTNLIGAAGGGDEIGGQ